MQVSQLQSKRLKGKSYRNAADALEKGKTTKEQEVSSTKGEPKRTRTVLDSVEIPVYRAKSELPSKSSDADISSDADHDEDENVSTKRTQRAAARKPIVLSDDDSSDDDPEIAPKKKATSNSAKNSRARKPVKRRHAMSDDGDDSFVEDSSNEGGSDEADSSEVPSEDDIPSPKSKPKKIQVKKKAAPPPSSASEDDMDVDEDLQSSAKKGKRKAKGDGNRPAKKQRVDTDPWKLASSKVLRDWTQMHAPPLEMFHFARVVVDEYTYLDGKVHALVNNLTAARHWVLSGTPPVHDFGALKTISAFLDVHLGIDDDGEGQSAEIKKRKKERTGKHTTT